MKSKGFSLIQLMISIAILALLGAFVALWLMRSAAVRELDAERNRLWDSHQLLQVQLERDFAAAILTTGESSRAGATRPAYHGIERFPAGSVRLTPDENDEIMVRFERDGHISAPVNITPSGSNQLTVRICIKDEGATIPAGECLVRKPDSSEAQETFDYFSQSFQTLEFFSVTSVTQKDILKKIQNSHSIGMSEISFTVADYTPSQASSFSFSLPQIRSIESARYHLNASNVLIREVRGIAKEVAMNMIRFQANYDFSRGSSFGAYWPPNQSPVSAPSQIPPSGGLAQVQWMHLTRALISTSYLSPLKPRSGGLENAMDEHWSVDSTTNQLVYSPATMVIVPGLTRDLQTVGASFGFCPTQANGNPQVGARCKPECDNLFTVASPTSAKWIGYKASSGSNYCKCATNHDTGYNDYPGDNAAGRNALVSWIAAPPGGSLSPEQTANNARVEACSAHYGCTGWVENKFFPGWAACHNRCIQGSQFLNGDSTINTTAVLEKLRSPYDAANPDTNNYLSCRVSHWCDDIRGNHLPDMPAGKWEARCACLPTNLDENGQASPPSSNFAGAEFIRWGNICNLGFSPGSGSQTCANTMNSDGQFILRTATNPRGLDQNQMAMCECLRTQPPEVQSRYYQTPANRPNGPFTDFTYRSMWTFDMRAENPSPSYPDPSSVIAPPSWPVEQQTLYSLIRQAPFNFSVPSTDLNFGRFLSPSARSVPGYTYMDGSTVVNANPPGGVSCIDAYAGWMLDSSAWYEANFGCCLSSDARCNQYENLPPTNPNLNSYRSFCNRRCGNWHNWAYGPDQPAYDRITGEIDIIRRALTNTPPGSPLPVTCGGSAPPPGGGGGSGTPNY